MTTMITMCMKKTTNYSIAQLMLATKIQLVLLKSVAGKIIQQYHVREDLIGVINSVQEFQQVTASVNYQNKMIQSKKHLIPN